MTAAKTSACACDEHEFPEPLAVPAGERSLTRQIGTFADFRRDLLRALRSHPALATLRARDEADLGVMLLEMWAYVADVVGFYDRTIADESYLRTAHLPRSVRRLVALLGYRPRPAVSSVVPLAVNVESLLPVRVKKGTQFSSGAFGEEPPQIFEVDEDTWASFLLNRGRLVLPRETRAEHVAFVLLRTTSFRLEAGSVVLLFCKTAPEHSVARVVARVQRFPADDGETYVAVAFTEAATFPAGTTVDDLALRAPGRGLVLRRPFTIATALAATATAAPVMMAMSYSPSAMSMATVGSAVFPQLDFAFATSGALSFTLLLGEVNREIRAGSIIVCQLRSEVRWFRVLRAREVTPPAPEASPVMLMLRNVVTELELDRSLNDVERRAGGSIWKEDDRDDIVVHHGYGNAGELVAPPRGYITPADDLALTAVSERGVAPEVTEALFEDVTGRGVHVRAHVDFAGKHVTLAAGEGWAPALRAPVDVRANVVHASRGETVSNEVLGDGDGATPNQAFKLAKSPLTYLPTTSTANPWPAKSTLFVSVDGVEWDEVPSFFDLEADETVFIVREDEEGQFWVVFGDGVNGARLPTGKGNVVASYRYGAGKATPPAGSITQVVKPVPHLSSVRNPVAAAGGSDRETPYELRKSGPASALTLGRAVSTADMEATVHAAPGVRATRAEWRWDREALAAVAVIHYIGADALEETVVRALAEACDPATPVVARRAQPLLVHLVVEVTHDSHRASADVALAVKRVLLQPELGLLVPEQLGIATVLYRSRVLEAVHGVAGVTHVAGIFWNGLPWLEFAKKAPTGRYFDFETPSVVVRAREASL